MTENTEEVEILWNIFQAVKNVCYVLSHRGVKLSGGFLEKIHLRHDNEKVELKLNCEELIRSFVNNTNSENKKQAGAEHGQAQFMMRLALAS